MAYIRVIDKKTGRTGTMPEENFDPTKYEALGAAPQIQPPTQPAGSPILNAVGGVVSSLAAPFARTGERALGVAEGVARMMLNKQIEVAQASGNEARFQQLLKIATTSSPLVANNGARQKELTDPLQVAKDAASIVSWGVPVGGAAKVFGKTLPAVSKVGGGALAGGMGGFGYSGETSPEGLVGSTAVGAGTGAILSKLFAGRGQPKAARNSRAVNFGNDIEKNIVNPKVATGPQMASKADEILQYSKEFDLKGAPVDRIKQINTIYDDLASQKDAILSKSTKKMPYFGDKGFEAQVRNIMTSEGGEYVGTLEQNNAIIGQLKKLEKSIDAEGNLGAKAISEFKSSLPVSKAFDKISKTVPLGVKEGPMVDLWHATDKIVTELDPAVKALTTKQSKLYSLTNGLAEASGWTVNMGIPFTTYIRTNLPVRGVQRVSDKLGRFLRGVGTEKVSSINTTAGSKALSFIKSKVPVAGAVGVSQAMGSQPTQTGQGFTDTPPATTPEKKSGVSQEQIQKLALADFMATGGKNLAKIKSLSDFFAAEGAGKLTETQLARDSAVKLSKSAMSLLQSGKVKTGMVGGPVEAFKGKFSAADQTTLTYQTLVGNLKATIAKARAGTSFTPNEEKMLNSYVPNIGDSYQEAQTKLALLQDPAFIEKIQAEFEALGGQ